MQIKTPFFIVNPKSFLYGEKLEELALAANKYASKYQVTVFFTVPVSEIHTISNKCKNLIITSQHMGNIRIGDSMGKVFSESLIYSGARATVINHADNPLSLSDLIETIQIAKEQGIISIVCASTLLEAELIAHLNPDIILAEETELIGTESTSDENYIKTTSKKIKSINPNILVEHGAGIRTVEDVRRLLQLGSEGVGVTSGIIKADNPIAMMKRMIEEVSLH